MIFAHVVAGRNIRTVAVRMLKASYHGLPYKKRNLPSEDSFF